MFHSDSKLKSELDLVHEIPRPFKTMGSICEQKTKIRMYLIGSIGNVNHLFKLLDCKTSCQPLGYCRSSRIAAQSFKLLVSSEN
jgi:hypothetical protein